MLAPLTSLLAVLIAALAPALLVGLGMGLRDAVRTLRDSAFASVDRYLIVYLAVPVLSLTALLTTVVAPLALAGAALGASPRTIAAAAAAIVVALTGGVDVVYEIGRLRRALRRAAVSVGTERLAVAGATGAGGLVVLGAALAAGAAVRTFGIPAALALVVTAADLGLAIPLLAAARRELQLVHARRLIPSRRRAIVARRRADRRPSVVFVSIDTLRADRLAAYGGQGGLMPNLDRLAAGGVVCDHAIAQSPWTLPSVASFLTGLVPARHGAGWPRNGFDLLARTPIAAGAWTLAEGLRAAGYRTDAIVSNPYLALQYGFGAGFDAYDNVSVESELLLCLRSTLAGRLLEPLLHRRISASGDIVTARGLRRLAELRADGAPYFLWLHYIDPHAPYGCGGTKSFRGDTLLSEVRADTDLDRSFDAIARLRAGEIRLDAADKARVVALYDEGVASVDRHVGRILAAAPPDQDTLVVVVSDHGEEFWEHGGVEHGHTCFDELVHVPLVFAGAGLDAGGRVAGVTRLVDVPPTVLGLLDLPAPPDLDGASLVAGVNGHARLATSGVSARCEGMLFAEEKVGVRTDRLKYVRSANGKEELYDLVDDPRELRDIAAGADLDWARALTVPSAGAGACDDGARDEPAVRAALHALGYV